MEIIYKKVGDLIPYEKNPRKNAKAVKYVANSIEEFGFKQPIIIDRDNVVVCGHTRLMATKQLGIEEVPCIVADDLTDAQLQSKLVGTTMQTTSYLSTSYDAKKSPFAPGNPLGGGREVVMNVNAGKNTKMVFGAKKQSEIILNKGTNMRITGVHFDGSTAYPRNGGAKPRVVIDVETF